MISLVLFIYFFTPDWFRAFSRRCALTGLGPSQHVVPVRLFTLPYGRNKSYLIHTDIVLAVKWPPLLGLATNVLINLFCSGSKGVAVNKCS